MSRSTRIALLMPVAFTMTMAINSEMTRPVIVLGLSSRKRPLRVTTTRCSGLKAIAGGNSVGGIVGGAYEVAGTGLGSTPLTQALDPLNDVRTGDAERVGDGFHREPSRGCELDSKVTFFERLVSRASLRISTSNVLRPSWRSSSRTRSSSLRRSAAGTTSSSARTASWPPSVISRLHRKTRLGESPWRFEFGEC